MFGHTGVMGLLHSKSYLRATTITTEQEIRKKIICTTLILDVTLHCNLF